MRRHQEETIMTISIIRTITFGVAALAVSHAVSYTSVRADDAYHVGSPVEQIQCPLHVLQRYLCVAEPVQFDACGFPVDGFVEPVCFDSGIKGRPIVICPIGFVPYDRLQPSDCIGGVLIQ